MSYSDVGWLLKEWLRLWPNGRSGVAETDHHLSLKDGTDNGIEFSHRNNHSNNHLSIFRSALKQRCLVTLFDNSYPWFYRSMERIKRWNDPQSILFEMG